LVENYFAKIKEFRGIATRYDKTDTSYRANLNLVATVIASCQLSTGPNTLRPSGYGGLATLPVVEFLAKLLLACPDDSGDPIDVVHR
jgi:hypothetical protein